MGYVVTLRYPGGPDSSMVEHLVQFQKGLGSSPGPVTFHAAIRVRFRAQGRPLFPIFTAAKPLSTLIQCFGFNCKQRVECRATPTNRAILFTAAPNIWKNRSQGLPHAGHADSLAIRAKKSVHYIANNEDTSNWYKNDPIFQLYRSTRPLLGHSTLSKCSHYHQTTLYVD